MPIVYPENPHFNRLRMHTAENVTRCEEGAHDPALLEWEGGYFAYSTDTVGMPCGYQIRTSGDLMHWNYVGSAFALDKTPASRSAAGLDEAYEWCVTDETEASGLCTRKDGSMCFWAPHCVRGADGKFWLFYCLTGYFGGSKSCIGIAKASSPYGPFVSEKLLVQSPAGWRTPNAIDPQFFSAEGRSFLVYGSYGMGLFLIELDPATGYRKDGLTYADFAAGRADFARYYGKNLARGSVEGGAIRYHERVPVLVGGKQAYKSFYYLTCSYGSLSSVYHIRCGRSERPEGPYVDVNGNELVCSTDLGTGNKLLGSFCREGALADVFCPGHNDLFVTGGGVALLSYHCRTHYFIKTKESESSNFHFLFLGQYAFNSDGRLVVSANRYAGERLQPIAREDFLRDTDGIFGAVLFSQSTDTEQERRVRLHADGAVTGAYTGEWRLYGENYVSLVLDGEEYWGVVMPCWIDHRGKAGLTVTALGVSSGMALHLNGEKRK